MSIRHIGGEGIYRGIFKPLEARGPAAITTFDGTASRTGSNLTFTSAADAVKAGYDANNPVLGTTVVLSNKTMVILSWSSSTVAVVDKSGDIAGAVPASVQAPLIFGVDSSGSLSTIYHTGSTDVAIADGGTEASTVAGARKNLGIKGNLYYNIGRPKILNLALTDADLKGFVGGFTDGRYGYFAPCNNGAYFGKVARLYMNFGGNL